MARMRWTFWMLGLAATTVFPWPGATEAGAQDVSVRTYLTPETVGVGRTFVLNLEISGTQTLESDPELPDLSAFASYLGSGTSTNMQIINGRTSLSLTVQYRYQALEEGTFQIPSISVQVEGNQYSTEPLQLKVVAGEPPQPGQAEESGDPAEIPSEDLFLTTEVSKKRVMEGEPLVVEYRIFTRVDVTSYSVTDLPEPQGFWVEELPLPDGPRVEQVTRDGREYASAVIRRVALVPTGPGTRSLDPMAIEAQVRVRRRTMDPFADFFNLDRSSLFGTVVSAGVLSNPVEITVDPLPPGRPDPFSGVVGELELSADLDQDSVNTNEAVTLTLTARGRGNIRAIPEPSLNLPQDFEVFPPEVSENIRRSGTGLDGTKTWRYVVIPRAPGQRTLPSLSMGYFDASVGAYATAQTPSLPLTVTGEMAEGPLPGVREGVATLREDIRFIHLGSPALRRVGNGVFRGWRFWAAFLLPLAGVLGSVALRAHRERVEGDPAYARQRRAGRVAKKRLARARALAGAGDPRTFYAEVARALRGLVADKVNVAEAGMQLRDITPTLRARGATEEVIQEMEACLEHCDRQRFAPQENDAQAEVRFLDRAGRVMTELNREVKP